MEHIGGGGGHQNVAFLWILIALMPVMSRKHSNHSNMYLTKEYFYFLEGNEKEEPRILGLAMIPGHHIVSISIDKSQLQHSEYQWRDREGYHWSGSIKCGFMSVKKDQYKNLRANDVIISPEKDFAENNPNCFHVMQY